jgi:hypothetical protein
MRQVTTDFNRLSPTYSHVDLCIKMSASCTFFVLLTSYRRQMVVQTFVVHTGYPPHNIILPFHEYHADIPWISVPLRRFCGTRCLKE